MKIDLTAVKKIIKKYRSKKGILIPLLQDIQAVYGYIPRESIELISRELSIFPVDVYGIATFYSQFFLSPRGKHTIRVCQGTACHVMGGKEILNYLSNTLSIHENETTKDGVFSLERVACLGCCALSPVIMIDKNIHSNMNTMKLKDTTNKYE